MMKRLVVPTLAIAIVMGAQPIALAHAFLDNAVPKVGSVVTAPPKTIRIQFTQPIEPAFSHIRLFTRDGKAVDTGPAATDPSDRTLLVAPITGTLSPGQYEVRWDVLSVDTHRTNGHFPFAYQP
jgi:methionine-rich copper-binding protein CopC